MSHQLRPYQTTGRRELFSHWQAGKRALMYQLITGGGKTVLFVQIIKDFIKAGKRVVLVAHREELITQAWQTLYNAQIYAGIIKSGVPENYSLACQVASIQTICRRSKLPHADLVIFDEAHHTQDDNSYGDTLARHWPRARVLGVTATPYRLSGTGFTDIFQELVCGPEFDDLTAAGYLTPLKYYVSYNPDLSQARVKSGDFVLDDIAKAMRLAPLVESYMEHCEGMSGICFAVNVGHSQEIVRQYLTAGIPAAHVDANTDPAVRRKLFADLREKKLLVLVNVGIATEGTDIPSIDFVQLARPTKSLSLFFQMVGRVTRPLWDAIKHAKTDEERQICVAASDKPYGIVLDNSGLYLEHGMPDQPVNWSSHFIGRPKRTKKVEEKIEILEFVAEDEDGRRIVSRKPEEIEGLKLIEINKLAREKVVNLKSLKEFDRLLEQLKRIPHVKKPGYVAYRNYRDYCKRNNFALTVEVWDYLTLRLVTQPGEAIEREKRAYEITHNADLFGGDALISKAREVHGARIAKIAAASVALSFLKTERAAYLGTPAI